MKIIPIKGLKKPKGNKNWMKSFVISKKNDDLTASQGEARAQIADKAIQRKRLSRVF